MRVFLLHGLFSIGQGATAPIIALLALELGASVAGAGLVVGLYGLGAMASDLPSGVLASRIGDRRLMILAAVLMAVTTAGIGLRPPLPLFAIMVVIMGVASAAFTLARIIYATESTPSGHRGRVMSTIGGLHRIGLFVGPVLGGLTIVPFGIAAPFFVQSIMSITAVATLFMSPDRPGERIRDETVHRPNLRRVFVQHKKTFATAGVVVVAFGVVRSARQAIIPLWGAEIGLGPSQVAFLFSVAAGVEVLLFYPVGQLMDRFGRRWASIPSLTLLSVGLVLVPFSRTLGALTVIALILGVGNGMGTGINLTLGSDLSPNIGRSEFLGVWRVLGDAGTASGPSLVALTVAIISLAFAPIVVAGVGAGGVILLWRAVPETLER